MPTKKPIVQVVLSQKYHEQLKKLAEKEDKSLSQMSAKIIENYFDNEENRKADVIKINNLKPFA